MSATLADFRLCVGVAPDAPLDERVGVDGLRRVFAPGTLGGGRGWWWAGVTADGALIDFGWSMGDLVDAIADMETRLVRVARCLRPQPSRCS